MILAVCVSLNEIHEKKKSFPWPRPKTCPKCGGPRLWFHGFVQAFFDGFKMGLWLRRLRCPDCRGIHGMRPSGRFRGFQARVTVIRVSMYHRMETGRWPPNLSRQRQGHWLRALKNKIVDTLGLTWLRDLPTAFEKLIAEGEISPSRSFKVKLLPGETSPTDMLFSTLNNLICSDYLGQLRWFFGLYGPGRMVRPGAWLFRRFLWLRVRRGLRLRWRIGCLQRRPGRPVLDDSPS